MENGLSIADVLALQNQGSGDAFGGSTILLFLLILLMWDNNGIGGFGGLGW